MGGLRGWVQSILFPLCGRPGYESVNLNIVETKQPSCSPGCMMGSTARHFSRTKSVESSSEIGWQRSYRILALEGLQADKLKQTTSTDIFFELLAQVCVHLPVTSKRLSCRRVVAVVPAKGGSVSVPLTNIMELVGRPLVDMSCFLSDGAGTVKI